MPLMTPEPLSSISPPDKASPTGAAGTQTAVLVHGGARDSYQLAQALSEAGMLETLVTDLFWPGDRAWAKYCEGHFGAGLRELVQRRSASGLSSSKVTQQVFEGVRGLLLDRLPHVPFSWRRSSNRAADTVLGRVAGKRAQRAGQGLVAYSYYAYDAIRYYGSPAMLFQVHPHPATMRRLLTTELAAHPECAESLQQEWELALPEEDYRHLVAEPTMASHIMVASTFTKCSLIENGVAAEMITVIPYGVDLEHFHPPPDRTGSANIRLELLFVGRINQRKGVSYLLEALRSFSPEQVHLTVCGRVVDDLKIFEEFGAQVTIRPSVSSQDLVGAYQAADLFVFPSVAEGFGQVLLEALACGLPILSTTHTAAPDLIRDGVEGFVVEPRRPDLLVDRIHWAMTHRHELETMHAAARRKAEAFTWGRFRTRAAAAVGQYLDTLPAWRNVSSDTGPARRLA